MRAGAARNDNLTIVKDPSILLYGSLLSVHHCNLLDIYILILFLDNDSCYSCF